MYFIHSYYVQPDGENCILTNTNYDEIEFCSSVIKENIFATQFHPELKSTVINPHPLFVAFVDAALKHKKNQ